MIRASVIGWPISHSRSPLIHGHWLLTNGIQGNYSKEAVAPEHLGAFIASLRTGDCVGANVTMPHKEAALSFIDEPDDRVRSIGALNTIWRQDGKLHATSTDGPGFISNVRQTLPDFNITAAPVTVLGAGGSARSLVDELLRYGVDHINVFNRTPARSEELAHHFGHKVKAVAKQQLPRSFTETGFLINTTPTGMNNSSELDLPWDDLSTDAVVADIVYTPLVTQFLKTAKAHDHRTIPGLGMLLHQAVVGFERWFGLRPVVTTELHDLVAQDIDPGYRP